MLLYLYHIEKDTLNIFLNGELREEEVNSILKMSESLLCQSQLCPPFFRVNSPTTAPKPDGATMEIYLFWPLITVEINTMGYCIS